jgi:hypothetical protein
VNNYGLNVRKNFDEFADAPLGRNDGNHQPFINALSVGAEYDLSKIREVSGKRLKIERKPYFCVFW